MCAWSVCLYRKSIFISFVISWSNLYFIACLFFIYRKYSFLISSLLIAFFRHSFRCPYWEFFFRHKPTYLDSTGLVVSAGCTGVSTLSQKFIGLNVQCRLLYTAKRVIVLSQANISLSQHLYRLDVTDM